MANLRIGRRSGLVLRGGRQRRESIWFAGGFFSTTIAAGSTAVAITLLNAAALAYRPFTVVRTRGVLYWGSDQEAASEVQALGYGHAVVSEQAAAIGVTALPTPVTDEDSDLWFVYEKMFSRLQVTPAGTGPSGFTREFDSKAMRKVDDGETVVTMAETAGISSGVILIHGDRFLVKLH